jgi:hypothetical protein
MRTFGTLLKATSDTNYMSPLPSQLLLLTFLIGITHGQYIRNISPADFLCLGEVADIRLQAAS